MKLLYSTVRKEHLKIRNKFPKFIENVLPKGEKTKTKSLLLTEVIEKYIKVKSFPIC